jgi:preprotein translocase subunit SecB
VTHKKESNEPKTAEVNSDKSFIVNAQYVKDLSFENPKIPMSIIEGVEPEIHVMIDVGAQAMAENLYEVGIRIKVEGTQKSDNKKTTQKNEEMEGTIFIADLDYAGLFTIKQENAEERKKILLVHCPALLFPFARNIICDSVRNGGYPPLMLEPFDFMGLYLKKESQSIEQK